jgi:hypothetical protein
MTRTERVIRVLYDGNGHQRRVVELFDFSGDMVSSHLTTALADGQSQA